MRLSEDRVNAIAEKIAHALVKKRMIRTRRRLYQVTSWVERPMLEHFRAEDEIDALVRADLARLSKCPPEGSYEYNAMFEKKKEEIARRRNFQS